MPNRPRCFLIGPPALPDIAAARLALEQVAAREAEIRVAIQPSQLERVMQQIAAQDPIRNVLQAEQAALQIGLPRQREIQELERRADELSTQRARDIAAWGRNSRAAQALTAGLQIDAATAARQAAMIDASVVHARPFESWSGNARAALDALRFEQRRFGPQPWRDRSPEYEVEEQPNSPLVVVKRTYRGGIPGRRRWAAMCAYSLDQLRLQFFTLQEPTAEDFAASYSVHPKTITRRLTDLGVASWRAFVKLCRSEPFQVVQFQDPKLSRNLLTQGS
jgi:hypothetical protein